MQLRLIWMLVLVILWPRGQGPSLHAQPASRGELLYAMHVTLSPSWFDPADTPAQLTPYALLYALHDAVVRPLPGVRSGPALAASWRESEDGQTYEFTLRPGLTFHNGDPCTAEDVVFSYQRYKGVGAGELHAHIHSVEAVDALTVRFQLHAPWPDFLTFYGTTATAAGLVVPKRYLEQVGEAGFQRHPIGLGPYKFVSHSPGVEVVLEAFEGYWRHVPYIKRLRIKGVPEGTTRLAMLKRGEADLAMALEGEVAAAVQQDPQLQLVDVRPASVFWVEFAAQWQPTSPWHDSRVRLAANYALNRQALNDAACLGRCPPTAVIIPREMDFALQTEALPYDPARAKQLLTEAGYPQGFDAGALAPIPPFYVLGEAVVNDLNAVGIRVTMRTMERAAFYAAWKEKKLPALFLVGSGVSGNAATRIASFVSSTGAYAMGGYPEIDALFQQQERERDPARREALLHRIQALTIARVMYAPLLDYRILVGVGPRVADHALHLLPMHLYPAVEEMRLKEGAD